MSGERKWTPGPWAFEIIPWNDEERNQPQSEWTGLYIGPEGEFGGIDHTIFEGAFAHGMRDGDPEADAHLIAAAPELYEALEAAKRCLLRVPNWDTYVSDSDLTLVETIDAALAHARGEDQ